MHRAFNDVLANVELYLAMFRWTIFVDSPNTEVIVKASNEETKETENGSRVLPWKRAKGNSDRTYV